MNSDDFTICCPECGHQFTKSVVEMGNMPDVSCSSCGIVLKIHREGKETLSEVVDEISRDLNAMVKKYSD